MLYDPPIIQKSITKIRKVVLCHRTVQKVSKTDFLRQSFFVVFQVLFSIAIRDFCFLILLSDFRIRAATPVGLA